MLRNLYNLSSQIHRAMYKTNDRVPLLVTLISRNVVDKDRIKHAGNNAGVTRRAINNIRCKGDNIKVKFKSDSTFLHVIKSELQQKASESKPQEIWKKTLLQICAQLSLKSLGLKYFLLFILVSLRKTSAVLQDAWFLGWSVCILPEILNQICYLVWPCLWILINMIVMLFFLFLNLAQINLQCVGIQWNLAKLNILGPHPFGWEEVQTCATQWLLVQVCIFTYTKNFKAHAVSTNSWNYNSG